MHKQYKNQDEGSARAEAKEGEARVAGSRLAPREVSRPRRHSSRPPDGDAGADSYGSTHPVLADPGFNITARFLNSNSIALPTGHLLTTGAEVVIRDGWPSNSDINNALP